MDKQTAIETLKRLASLISAKKELEDTVLDDIDRQTTSNLKSIRAKFFDRWDILHPSLARETLNVIKNEAPESSTDKGCLYGVIGFLALTISFLPLIIGWTAYLILLTAIVVLFLIIKFAPNKSETKGKIEISAKGEQAEEYKKVQESLKSYEQEVQRGVQQLAERKAKYPEAFAECLQEIEHAKAKENEVRKQINNYNAEIASINMIPPEYYHLIDDVIKYLQSGRTDDYKEALNIAINKELNKKREAEQRQAEERARRERENLGIAKCNHCQNRWSCPKEIQESGAGLTCGAYKPYGT